MCSPLHFQYQQELHREVHESRAVFFFFCCYRYVRQINCLLPGTCYVFFTCTVESASNYFPKIFQVNLPTRYNRGCGRIVKIRYSIQPQRNHNYVIPLNSWIWIDTRRFIKPLLVAQALLWHGKYQTYSFESSNSLHCCGQRFLGRPNGKRTSLDRREHQHRSTQIQANFCPL